MKLMTALDLSDYQPTANLALAETLPARWYIEPEFLALEAEKIFYKTWQPVGRAEDVLRAGDFFTCDVLDQPLVVVRNRAGELRAFYNVCAHRAAVVAHGRGNRKSLQCKYHGWTYDLDGKLMRAPEFEGVENWRAEDKVCLKPLRDRSLGTLGLRQSGPGGRRPCRLSTYGAIADEIAAAGFNLDQMRLIERRDYLIDCNWKVYVDNYLEGYHLADCASRLVSGIGLRSVSGGDAIGTVFEAARADSRR